MKTRSGEKIKLASIEELLGVVNEESAMDIEIAKIHSFKSHPFKVLDDERMQELVESVKEHGILTPVLLRPCGVDEYEMISGHRRMHAAQLAGLTTVPSIIREMDDDAAVVFMVDSNIQREELLPSEKAFAFKMKMDAMRHQGTCRHDGDKLESVSERKTAFVVGESSGTSARSVQRYIRLTELIPELLDFVDQKRLQFTVAVDISYIDKEIQKWLYEYIRDNGSVRANQIAALRSELGQGVMTQPKMILILNENLPGKKPGSKITLSEKKLREYFPSGYTTTEMRSVILELLDNWKECQNGGIE
ncbi:ParB-like nuclease domain [Anaerobutyricum hallii]|uniref:ParB-like nuclease domain n=1 Tax=Anaerobutyricum hallii TaxID=39488 RepID=A0A285PU56_9FIRM|nr:ParB/RepB/Spo0J family partition protein [Anaerobutyricum hallii]SOB72706.1 ParB-like nuclease domain [Anaerobutyricum hallii]